MIPSATMARRTYTAEEKAAALALYATDGPTAVEERMGVPPSTVVSWAKRANVRTHANENRSAALEASRLTFEQRRTDLAHALLDDVHRLRGQLFAPVTTRQAMTVNDGAIGSHVEIVDVELDEPTFADKKSILTCIGIAVDKVQILSGGATSRTEDITPAPDVAAGLRDELEQRRQAKRVA